MLPRRLRVLLLALVLRSPSHQPPPLLVALLQTLRHFIVLAERLARLLLRLLLGQCTLLLEFLLLERNAIPLLAVHSFTHVLERRVRQYFY